MVGNRPSGRAARLSALPSTPASQAAWERAHRRREEIDDAAWEQRRLADRDAAAAAQARAAAAIGPSLVDRHAAAIARARAAAAIALPLADRDAAGATHAHAAAAAIAPPSQGIAEEPPQLHCLMPGSQAADRPADSSAPRHPYVPLSPSPPPVDAPGAASAAVGVPVADCVDNRGQPAFKIPTVPMSSPPHPKPTTPSPSPDPRFASAPAVAAPVASTPGGSLSTVATHLQRPPLSAASAVAGPWTAAQVSFAAWTHGVAEAAPSTSAELEMEKAATEAAAAAVATAPSPLPASLSGPFPPSPAPRRPRVAAKVGAGSKRRQAKQPSGKTAGPPTKKTRTAADTAAAGCDGDGTAVATGSSTPTPEATAAWVLVKGEVAKVVRDANKALWSALKQSTEQIENLKASTNRLEARVDAQGQGNERTAMAVAAVRVAVKNGMAATGDRRKEDGSGSGSLASNSLVKDEKPVVNRDVARAAAMALAPENEVRAAKLRRPIRAAVKHLVATTNVSREVLMDSETSTASIHSEAIKALEMTPGVAHSYLMDFIYFPSASKNAAPTLKRPHTVVVATISHAVAQLRGFVLKPYFKVLGFPFNPMPRNKAKKWYDNDGFLTSYKGEKAVVAAAKNLFTKIGGSFRIVKDTSAGGRFHVDMTVGHYSLIASFVRNEFEIALGHRQRRRKGNGSGTYYYWVDEFAHSVKHLAKNHKDNNIHAGYRISDTIDPDIVVRTTTGVWVFTAPAALSPALSTVNKGGSSTLARSALPPRSTNCTGAPSRHPPTSSSLPPTGTAGQRAASRGDGVTRPAIASASAVATPNCIDDHGIGADDDGRPSDGTSNAPRSGVVLVVDDDTDDRAGAAMLGLKEDGAGSGVGGSKAVESDGGGPYGLDSDEEGSDDVGGRTSSSDDDDSSDDGDGSDQEDESDVDGDEGDEEEGRVF